ncbi:hypothetical protein [Photobacterium aquae]|uniref:hypothetical protein n=1 Tax=Photobacterium aquae TaxID=1195763 RepID=UPI000AF21977|nr:hypothetical protein [Photobacterium aquae]
MQIGALGCPVCHTLYNETLETRLLICDVGAAFSYKYETVYNLLLEANGKLDKHKGLSI